MGMPEKAGSTVWNIIYIAMAYIYIRISYVVKNIQSFICWCFVLIFNDFHYEALLFQMFHQEKSVILCQKTAVKTPFLQKIPISSHPIRLVMVSKNKTYLLVILDVDRAHSGRYGDGGIDWRMVWLMNVWFFNRSWIKQLIFRWNEALYEWFNLFLKGKLTYIYRHQSCWATLCSITWLVFSFVVENTERGFLQLCIPQCNSMSFVGCSSIFCFQSSMFCVKICITVMLTQHCPYFCVP